MIEKEAMLLMLMSMAIPQTLMDTPRSHSSTYFSTPLFLLWMIDSPKRFQPVIWKKEAKPGHCAGMYLVLLDMQQFLYPQIFRSISTLLVLLDVQAAVVHRVPT